MIPLDARAVLGDVLRPPPGSTLDRAVALTYTLDLATALEIPLAFAGRVVRESSDPIAVMEAVRQSADRVDIFCQAGQITMPREGNDLFAFLERSVHQVRRPRPGRLFHPKLWALRFRAEAGDDQPDHLRLLILSRNLADDRSSWDVCLRLEGGIGDELRPANRALADLLRHTVGLCVTPPDHERRLGIDALASDLHRAVWSLPEGVRDLTVHALGLPGAAPPDFAGSRGVVVTPFCTARGLAHTLPSGKGFVISAQEELDRLADGTLDGHEVFVISELAGIHLDAERDGETHTALHAKVYVVESGHTARVLLGSANATDAAFDGNVELLVELTGSRKHLGIDVFLAPSTGIHDILEPYQRADPPDTPDDERLRELLRDLAAVPLTATVTRNSGGLSLHVTSRTPIRRIPDGIRVTLQLVTRPGEAALLATRSAVDCAFGGLGVVDVTAFVVITADDGHGGTERAVVCASLVGDPEGRLDEVIARQIDTPEKFLLFLALLLGLAGDKLTLSSTAADRRGSWMSADGQGIFELLMRGLVDHQDQLADLARLVDRLQSMERGREALPDGFTDLWRTIDVVRREIAAAEVR